MFFAIDWTWPGGKKIIEELSDDFLVEQGLIEKN